MYLYTCTWASSNTAMNGILSHMCDTAVLTTATAMSPGDGTEVVDVNKHCQLTEGITS